MEINEMAAVRETWTGVTSHDCGLEVRHALEGEGQSRGNACPTRLAASGGDQGMDLPRSYRAEGKERQTVKGEKGEERGRGERGKGRRGEEEEEEGRGREIGED